MKRPGRPQWLLIKHRDDLAEPGRDVVKAEKTSVKSGRPMEEIAAGKRARRTAGSAGAGSKSAGGRRRR